MSSIIALAAVMAVIGARIQPFRWRNVILFSIYAPVGYLAVLYLTAIAANGF
ncbi:MAG: hypothetical protein AAGE92_00080 [Cyanobacteria bacterium P01_G01_bin.4]